MTQQNLFDSSVIPKETKANALSQWFTPVGLANKIARWASVEGKHVLEPSCGTGRLVDACYKNDSVINLMALSRAAHMDIHRASFKRDLSKISGSNHWTHRRNISQGCAPPKRRLHWTTILGGA